MIRRYRPRPLTEMQRKMLDAIRTFARRNGMPPTVRELGDKFGLKSSTVFAHLQALERKGYLRRTPGKARGLHLLDVKTGQVLGRGGAEAGAEAGLVVESGVRAEAPDLPPPSRRGIPLLGRVPAGPLDLAVELQGDSIQIDPDFFGEGELFALRVRGQSMIEAGILDGDTVIVARAEEARDGEIVVALVGDEATVKRLRRWPDAVVLEPANQGMEPLVYRKGGAEPRIIGRVVGVLRKL